ncbi:MAG: isoprenylcysteine carboxylmethyltransferase family protein [Anaerolineae bacterium]
MPVEVIRWAALLLWLFWIIRYWGGGTAAVSSLEHSGSRADTLLMLAIAVGTLLLLGTGAALSVGWWTLPAWGGEVLGLLLLLCGVAGTFYCRGYLGRLWTAEASLQQEHQLVDSGPYSVVRHPIYTAACVLYGGTALVFPAWWNLLAAGIVIISYGLKARLEDYFLAANLSGYDAYQARVRWRLLPRVW